MNHPTKPLKASRIRPVERSERRTGLEVAEPNQNAVKAKVDRLAWIKTILRAGLLLLNGWTPTDLGLWQRRTKLPIGRMTETYNFKTVCEKQFGPGETTKPKEKG